MTLGYSIVRWLTYPDTWDFVNEKPESAENPFQKEKAYAISIWNTGEDEWEHRSMEKRIISNITFSQTYIWKDINKITFYNDINVMILDEVVTDTVVYEITVNDFKKDGVVATPGRIVVDIPGSVFQDGENLIKFSAHIQGEDKTTNFAYKIIKENRDTFDFERRLEHDLSHELGGSAKVMPGIGIVAVNKQPGSALVDIPTEGKSKVFTVTIDVDEDAVDEKFLQEEMDFVQELEDGKVYEKRLFTDYGEIVNLNVV